MYVLKRSTPGGLFVLSLAKEPKHLSVRDGFHRGVSRWCFVAKAWLVVRSTAQSRLSCYACRSDDPRPTQLFLIVSPFALDW